MLLHGKGRDWGWSGNEGVEDDETKYQSLKIISNIHFHPKLSFTRVVCDKQHFIHSFILAINIYLRAYNAYSTVLSHGFTVGNKTDWAPAYIGPRT